MKINKIIKSIILIEFLLTIYMATYNYMFGIEGGTWIFFSINGYWAFIVTIIIGTIIILVTNIYIYIIYKTITFINSLYKLKKTKQALLLTLGLILFLYITYAWLMWI
jgi:hypothetical protein